MEHNHPVDISVLIPALNESENVAMLVPRVRDSLASLGLSGYEILVIDGGSKDDTVRAAEEAGATVVLQNGPGYGGALRTGFKTARGNFIVTCDADLSHEPEFIAQMWATRHRAEVVIASRYVPGGMAEMPLDRLILSRILNKFMAVGLSVPIRDISSGFRMYRRDVIDAIHTTSPNFNVLQEILLKVLAKGWRVIEVPFCYKPRKHGRTHAKLIKFGKDYLRTFGAMWRLRNSIDFCDYDERAYNSRIFLQRYWQRKRCKIILGFVSRMGKIVDVGCGSSIIISALPNAIALDINIARLRYIRKTNQKSVCATAGMLPFKNNSFSVVICSEVIEHTREENSISELARVLQPGGTLVIGTPDYGKLTWRIIEAIYARVNPGGYAEQHITKYSFDTLTSRLKATNIRPLEWKYICNSEMILRGVKETTSRV